MAHLILTEILPGFGMPSSLQSDHGPEFTSQITENTAGALPVPRGFTFLSILGLPVRLRKPSPKRNWDQINDQTLSRPD